jgi:trigger factor
LKTEKTFTEDHQVRVRAEFEQETLEGFKRKAARKIAKSTRIPGFRPGKAPYPMVVAHVGEASILEEAIDLMLNEVYPQVLDQEKIEPYGPGSLENIPSQEPPVFEFVIPLSPETELGDVDSLKKPYEPPVINDDDVEEFITQLRQNQADIVPVDGAAKVGQLVYMTVEATDENPKDSEEAVLVKSSPQQTLIPTVKEQKESEWPYKGFARELIGKKAEDQFTLTHTFSDKSKDSSFAGKTVRFEVNVQSVKKLELPEINEEFLTSVGGFESEDSFRQAVHDKLENDRTSEYEDTYYLELVDSLRSGATIKYPPQMIKDEEDDVLHRIEHDLEHKGLDLDVYLKLRKMDKDQFIEEEVKQTAVDRLERSLIMDAITKKFGVKVTQEQMQTEVTGVINSLLMSGEYEQAEKQLGKKRFTEAISNEAANNALEKAIRQQLRMIAAPESMPVLEEVTEEEAVEEVMDALQSEIEAESVELETASDPVQDEVSKTASEEETQD